MSSSQSQDNLYKDKCLYIAMNVMLSKIQRLEKEVAQLKAQNSSKHTNESVSSLKKRIDMIELRQNEQNNNNTSNNNGGNRNGGSALDAYLNDIDLVEDFQLKNLNNRENKQISDK
jgi:hypothetical protein